MGTFTSRYSKDLSNPAVSLTLNFKTTVGSDVQEMERKEISTSQMKTGLDLIISKVCLLSV